MEDGAGDGGAFDETVVLRYFENLPDRRQRGKVIHPFDEVLLLCLLADAEAMTDIARFGERKLGQGEPWQSAPANAACSATNWAHVDQGDVTVGIRTEGGP